MLVMEAKILIYINDQFEELKAWLDSYNAEFKSKLTTIDEDTKSSIEEATTYSLDLFTETIIRVAELHRVDLKLLLEMLTTISSQFFSCSS